MSTRNLDRKTGIGKVVDGSGQELCSGNYDISIDQQVIDTPSGPVGGMGVISGAFVVLQGDLWTLDSPMDTTLILADGTPLPVLLLPTRDRHFEIKMRGEAPPGFVNLRP